MGRGSILSLAPALPHGVINGGDLCVQLTEGKYSGAGDTSKTVVCQSFVSVVTMLAESVANAEVNSVAEVESVAEAESSITSPPVSSSKP